jgi:predicted nucleotidyltransferase
VAGTAMSTAEPLPECLGRLPLHRRTTRRFVERVLPRPEVAAAFLHGSVASNDADPHSDLDLVIVVRDVSMREALHARARELMQELGHVLVCRRASANPYVQLGVLEGPLVVDVALMEWESLRPAPSYTSLVRLKDADGRLETLRRESRTAQSGFDGDALAAISTHWWRCVFEAGKDLLRGDLLKVLEDLWVLCEFGIRPLARALEGLPVGGTRQGEPRDTRNRAAEIVLSAGSTPTALARAVLHLHELFLSLREQVQRVRPHSLPDNEPELERVLRDLLRRAG